MGLELAEIRLLDALRADGGQPSLDIRVVGGRRARNHARRLGARWVPARAETLPRRAVRGADLIHLIGLDLPPPQNTRFVAMVHDLSPLHYDDEGTLPRWMNEVTERASLLLTPSAFTAGELGEHFGVPSARIRVIGGAPALDANEAEPLSPDELRTMGIEPPFVLRYGGYTKRKNVPLLMDAWAQVPIGTLVLTGPPQTARERILRDAPSLDRVVVLDYVPDRLLARLLRTASALVSVSSYEGFGLPPLEALAAGVPVVATAAPFVNEVCGEAALLVPGNADALANALIRVLTDHALAAELADLGPNRAAGFTWANVASAVREAYAVKRRALL
jgi:glycosyltransferase involved in cell wall biosynthesis